MVEWKVGRRVGNLVERTENMKVGQLAVSMVEMLETKSVENLVAKLD
jgi:hypothetical protein